MPAHCKASMMGSRWGAQALCGASTGRGPCTASASCPRAVQVRALTHGCAPRMLCAWAPSCRHPASDLLLPRRPPAPPAASPFRSPMAGSTWGPGRREHRAARAKCLSRSGSAAGACCAQGHAAASSTVPGALARPAHARGEAAPSATAGQVTPGGVGLQPSTGGADAGARGVRCPSACRACGCASIGTAAAAAGWW